MLRQNQTSLDYKIRNESTLYIVSEALVFALSLLVCFVRSRRKEPNSVEEDLCLQT